MKYFKGLIILMLILLALMFISSDQTISYFTDSDTIANSSVSTQP